MSAILKPHCGRTIQRMTAQKTVSRIQDGSVFTYTTEKGVKDREFVGKRLNKRVVCVDHLWYKMK
ncbi:MAG: hypothetical protein HS132_05275 [Planctomycetia bacterium]|nr:hypothetical protein [Planctomycetia bacterium]